MDGHRVVDRRACPRRPRAVAASRAVLLHGHRRRRPPRPQPDECVQPVGARGGYALRHPHDDRSSGLRPGGRGGGRAHGELRAARAPHHARANPDDGISHARDRHGCCPAACWPRDERTRVQWLLLIGALLEQRVCDPRRARRGDGPRLVAAHRRDARCLAPDRRRRGERGERGWQGCRGGAMDGAQLCRDSLCSAALGRHLRRRMLRLLDERDRRHRHDRRPDGDACVGRRAGAPEPALLNRWPSAICTWPLARTILLPQFLVAVDARDHAPRRQRARRALYLPHCLQCCAQPVLLP